ncbi:MAG: T9SS type A sorting domain-containing protein, partial [Ignavibacteriales bacterium]|nr:T9SS type A sorting domain-containing protein [Ignavibacteriales bacterium]
MIQVFDILGRVVGNLVNEVQSPGRYTLVWNASQLPTGVYFMRMRAGGFVNTKKLVVLK